MSWLEKIQPPKFLRYFFYIAYSWYRPYVSERGDAHTSALLFLWVVHMPLIFIVQGALGETRMPLNKASLLIYVFILLAIHYYLFYYKKKWIKIVKEFKHLEKKDRFNGTVYLLIYLVLSFVILIPLSMKIGDIHR